VLYESAALKPPFRAEDMQGLFKKVTKGEFVRIPRNFSMDLAGFLDTLLQVDPSRRPSCEEILRLPQIERRLPKFEELFREKHCASSTLLETIKFPRSLQYLSDRLPGPNYEDLRNQSEPKPSREELNLPKLAHDQREDSNHRARFPRESSVEKIRARDKSDNAPRDHKKILRENYGALKQLKTKQSYSRSTPLRQEDVKHAHEMSLDSIRTRQLRNLSSNGRLISHQPLQESRRLRILKLLQVDSSSRRLPQD
jgi:NIMA (never in mitosis gene a)-related kinase